MINWPLSSTPPTLKKVLLRRRAERIFSPPTLALPLRPVWEELETNAARLDRLARQLARVNFGVVDGRRGPALAVEVPLAEPGEAVRVLLEGKEVRYVLQRSGEALAADLPEPRVDQGVFLLLAELAARVVDDEPA